MRLKGQVRIKPVIAERDGKSDREEHEKEERDLEPVDSKEPDIDWDRSQGEKQCADEKRADEPVDSLEGYSRKHILAGQWKIRGRSAAIHHVTGCLREGHSSLDLPDRAIYFSRRSVGPSFTLACGRTRWCPGFQDATKRVPTVPSKSLAPIQDPEI